MGEWVDTPLIGQPYENVEEVQLDQWASTIVDGIPVAVEGKLHIVKRPGLEVFANLGNTRIDGLYWWDKQRVAVAVTDGRVVKITDATGSLVELTGSTALRKSALVSFADDGTRLAMANGGQIVHTTVNGPLTTLADAEAPVEVTHLVHLDSYLIANEAGSNLVQFSDLNDLTNWNALDFFSAESDPDDVVAIQEAYREIIVLGRQSVEFWINDGVTPFSRIQGSAQPFGTEAPYSLTRVGGTWMWLDQIRRLVMMQGRQVTPVSTPYDRVLQDMVAVDDAVGYTVSVDGHPIYVLNFPTARQTLAFNYVTGQWHKWGYWDTQAGQYQRFRGLTYCYARAWNLHLVGDHSTGLIYKMNRQTFTDNGNPIRTLVRTGHLSYGKESTKRSNIFRVRCKRGVANSSVSNPQIMMRQRINNKAQWSQERWKSLGQVGQHELYAEWRRNGIYKTCQREIVHADASEFVLVAAQEHVDYLGR